MTLWTSPLPSTGNLTPDQSASKLATIRAALSCLFCVRQDRRKPVIFILSRPIAYYATPVQYVETGVWSWPYLEGRINIVRHPARAHKYDSRLPRLHISKVHVSHILAFVTNPHIEHFTHIQPRHGLTFKSRASYIQDGRTATFQMLHFIYFFNKYKY